MKTIEQVIENLKLKIENCEKSATYAQKMRHQNLADCWRIKRTAYENVLNFIESEN